jgi:hypothetical protein
VARTLRTADYSEEARARLGKEIAKARLADGHKWRTTFAAAAGISLRSLSAAEKGEPTVGQATLYAIGRTLRRWTEDTPRAILDGEAIPSTADDEPIRMAGPESEQLGEIGQDLLRAYDKLIAENKTHEEAMLEMHAKMAAFARLHTRTRT